MPRRLADLRCRDPGDLLDALGRVLPAELGVEFERRTAGDGTQRAGDLVAAGEREGRILPLICAAARVVAKRRVGRTVPDDALGRVAVLIQVGAGEETPRVVPHQEGAVGPARDELPVEPALLDHDAGEAERQRPVAARADAEPLIGLVRKAGAARVDHHERCAARLCVGDARRMGEPGRARVVAPQDEAIGSRQIGHGHRHAEGVGEHHLLGEGAQLHRDGRVGAAVGAAQALDPDEPILHRGAGGGRDAERHGLGARFLGEPREPVGNRVERLVPPDPLPAGVGIALGARALQRVEQAVGMMHQSGGCPALGAKRLAGGMLRVGLDRGEAAILDCRDAPAAGPAERAETVDTFTRHGLARFPAARLKVRVCRG